MSVSKQRVVSHDYRLLIGVVKSLLRKGLVIEAFERLQELEILNQNNLEEKK